MLINNHDAQKTFYRVNGWGDSGVTFGSTSDVKNILESPNPFVLQISLNDFYVEYQLNVHIKSTNKLPLLRSHIHQYIHEEML